METSTTVQAPPQPVVVPMIMLHRSLGQFANRLDEVNGKLYCFEGGYLSLVRQPEGMIRIRAKPPGRYEDPDDRSDDPEKFPSATVPEESLMTAGLAWLAGMWHAEPSTWSENGMMHPETQAYFDRLHQRMEAEHAGNKPEQTVESIADLGKALDGIGTAIHQRQEERKALCAEMLAKERALIGRTPADTLSPNEIVNLAKAIGKMGATLERAKPNA